ncbi:MAG: hypothetical protein RLZZ306_3240 [Bacteroidota bacterium]|jgi:uncharacterized membrane protein YbhN (UPF0104 family)
MKENDKLKELTLEELQAKYKQAKAVVIGVSIVMIIAIISLIYLAVKSKNYTKLTFIFVLPITLMPVFISLGQLKTEIKLRNNEQ